MNSKEIIDLVCQYMSVKPEDLLSPCRDRDLVDCRKMIALLLYERGDSTPLIARQLNRHPSTVWSSIKSAKDLIDTYPIMKRIYNRLTYHLAHANKTD